MCSGLPGAARRLGVVLPFSQISLTSTRSFWWTGWGGEEPLTSNPGHTLLPSASQKADPDLRPRAVPGFEGIPGLVGRGLVVRNAHLEGAFGPYTVVGVPRPGVVLLGVGAVPALCRPRSLPRQGEGNVPVRRIARLCEDVTMRKAASVWGASVRGGALVRGYVPTRGCYGQGALPLWERML